VATNVLGKSGRAMLEDIITGEDNPEHLASLALGHLPPTIKIKQSMGRCFLLICFCRIPPANLSDFFNTHA
jgi:hypothetical protein